MNRHAAPLICLSMFLAGCNAPARPARAPVTQVILVTVDTLRADRLGIYGYRNKPTSPVLDAWAANAVVFERAYAPAPWTVPSIGALLTGRYPVEVGVYTNRGELDGDVVTLPELFRQRGFRTASFNTHYLLINEYGGFRRGFEDVYPVVAPPEDDSIHKIPFAAAEPALMEWLELHAQDPFFVWLHDMSPHEPASEGNPYLADPAWARGSDWRAYDPEIRWMDDLMGRIFAKLQALGIAERALVIFTADHGEAFLEHDLAGHQDVMYDEVLHIPLVLRYPGMAGPARVAEPVELFDVFRTVVELAGLPLPAGTRGESLTPLIDGGAARQPPRHLFHARYHFEHGEHQLAVRDARWKLIVRTPPSGQRYDDRPLWGLHRPGTRFELYDLETDRGELSNVIDAQTAVALRLEQALWAWRELTETPVMVGPKRQPRELDAGTEEALRALGYD